MPGPNFEAGSNVDGVAISRPHSWGNCQPCMRVTNGQNWDSEACTTVRSVVCERKVSPSEAVMTASKTGSNWTSIARVWVAAPVVGDLSSRISYGRI
eukprot:888407-Rhodomonas_salina.3